MITIAISTKNRCGELERCLESIRRFAAEAEVLIIDDGSTDSTPSFVPRAILPHWRYVRHESSAGYIIRRNQAVSAATFPVVVFMDDDATLTSVKTVSDVLKTFDRPDVIGASIPYVDCLYGPEIKQKPPNGDIYIISSFRGTACAVRRSSFIKLGGFREIFIHQNEETEFCTKAFASGGLIVMVDTESIAHYESPRRSSDRIIYYAARNPIIYAMLLVPIPYLFWHLFVAAVKGPLRTKDRKGTVFGIRGSLAGMRDCLRYRRERTPISRGAYRFYRKLRVAGVLPLQEVLLQLEELKRAGELNWTATRL